MIILLLIILLLAVLGWAITAATGNAAAIASAQAQIEQARAIQSVSAVAVVGNLTLLVVIGVLAILLSVCVWLLVRQSRPHAAPRQRTQGQISGQQSAPQLPSGPDLNGVVQIATLRLLERMMDDDRRLPPGM